MRLLFNLIHIYTYNKYLTNMNISSLIPLTGYIRSTIILINIIIDKYRQLTMHNYIIKQFIVYVMLI